MFTADWATARRNIFCLSLPARAGARKGGSGTYTAAAGYWLNLGGGNKNYELFGVVLQRQVTDRLTLGGEIYHSTSAQVNESTHTGFNIGAIYDFTEHFSLLTSVGRDLQGDNRFTSFLGVEWTF